MKKILILIMSCQDSFFVQEEQICKDTYLSRLPDNIDYIIYRGGYDKTEYIESEHLLKIKSGDGLYDTFDKTYKALDYLINTRKMFFDTVFRTNTSTYINIPLLNYFAQHNKDISDESNSIWGSEIFFHIKPDEHYKHLYLRGNGVFYTYENCHQIINHGIYIKDICNIIIDDWAIGNILNAVLKVYKDKHYTTYLHGFREGWYKSSLSPYTPHQVCRMNNENIEWDFLKTCMIIQIKNWYNRDEELTNFKIIDEVFKNNVDNDIEKTYQMQLEYDKNPDIFLGEKYGFKPWNDLFKQKRTED